MPRASWENVQEAIQRKPHLTPLTRCGASFYIFLPRAARKGEERGIASPPGGLPPGETGARGGQGCLSRAGARKERENQRE